MYDNFFDNFFDSLSSSWNRMFKEKDGYAVLEAKDHKGFIVVFNTLGVSEKDIRVTTSDYSQTKYSDVRPSTSVKSKFIRVYGSTTIPELNDQTYTVNYELEFRSDIELESKVQYMVKDGLTIVYLKTKENITESNSIDADNISNGGTFEW